MLAICSYTSGMSNYLNELNDAQRGAVEQIEGPMMIVAGAGSGKTRVLTYRIAHLIEKGVDPFNILALTFTNKAAKEMKKRIEAIAGSNAKNIWMGTFHSVFARILRSEASRLGYSSSFTIYDTDDSKSVLKAIVKELMLSPEEYKPGRLYSRISLAKNNFITPTAYRDNIDLMAEDNEAKMPQLVDVYEQYVKRCFKAGAMDFDDLLLKPYELFKKHPDTLNKYQHRFKFLLVDEYQDTNNIQYLIIRKLANAHQNLCVVGDDAQSIYAFRGANIQNIISFEKDYPEYKVFHLEQNYRSTGNIVGAAGEIIKQNKAQLKKNLWTQNHSGDKIKVFRTLSDREEGNTVVDSIYKERMQLGLSYSDFAILYRTNSQSRSFEESFRKYNLPYKIVGGLSFYQRKEVKDLLAYFRLALNPQDEEALKRVINYPLRGIGSTTVNKLLTIANQEDVTVMQLLENTKPYPDLLRSARKLEQWRYLIGSMQVHAQNDNAYDAAIAIAKASGIVKLLNEDKSAEGEGRYENIQQLLGGVKEYEDNPENEDKSLAAYMQQVSLMTDADTKDTTTDSVTMMTVHQAKGLEWSHVYVVGLEENLFPSGMSLNVREDLEEERRLFYVAVTRAEKKAFLSYALERFRWGNIVYNEPSRFINEIDPQYLDYELNEKPEVAPKYVTPRPLITSTLPVRSTESTNFVPQDLSNLQAGKVIEHNRFGRGKVLSIDGSGEKTRATIFFKDIGQKEIILKYAKMRYPQEN